MSESKKGGAAGADIRSFFGGGAFAKKKADDAAAAKAAAAATPTAAAAAGAAKPASSKKDKADKPAKESKAPKPATKKAATASSGGSSSSKKKNNVAVDDDDDEVMEVDEPTPSDKAKKSKSAAAAVKGKGKGKDDAKESPEPQAASKSPHFAAATTAAAKTETAPKAEKSTKAKKRIRDEEEDDEEGEAAAAAAAVAAAASNVAVSAPPPKPVVKLVVSSPAKASKAKANVSANDFFAAAAAASAPAPRDDAESKAKMAARVAEHARRQELEAQAAAIEASIAEAQAREKAEQEEAIALVQEAIAKPAASADAQADAPMEDVAAPQQPQPQSAAAVPDEDEEVAEIPKPVSSPARMKAPKSPARSPLREAKSPQAHKSPRADAPAPSTTSSLAVPSAAASAPAAAAASPRKSPSPAAPRVASPAPPAASSATAKPAAAAAAPAAAKPAPKPTPAPSSAPKKSMVNLSDDMSDDADFGGSAAAAYDPFGGGGRSFNAQDDAAIVQPSPLKKAKTEGGESAPKKWKYGQQPAGPSAPGSKEVPVGKPNCLTGLTFVLTGEGESLSRADATDLLKKYGARVTTSISKKTDYLVEGSDPGESKMAKARELKTKIIDEDAMLQLIRDKSKGWVPPSSSTATGAAGATSANSNAAGVSSAIALAPPGAILPKPVASIPAAPPGSAQEQAILRSGLQTASSLADMLWVDAHRPMSVGAIIGNPSLVKHISEWLDTWHDKRKHRERHMDPKLAAKVPKALLISGPPGIGKSTAANVIAKSKGFEVIEFNASDVRNKKSLEAVVGDITGNRGLGEFFGKSKAGSANGSSASSSGALRPAGKTVIIMDEVDGMGGNEDRGGMQELVSLIKATRTPIICIANDAGSPKMKTLKNYVESLTWRRVSAAQIAPRILEICRKEGLSIDRQSVEKIAESTHGDIRQILNFLQMFRKSTTAVGFDQVKQRMDLAGKDFDLGAFDVVPDLFKPVPVGAGNDWIGDRQNKYFVDSDIIPLFVAENYLHAKPHIQAAMASRSNDKLRRMASAGQPGAVAEVLGLEVIAEAADSISCGDLLSDAMYSEQDYTLMPSHAILSTVYPAYLMRAGMNERLHFPALLGKQSTRNKNMRIAREFKTALSIDIHADSNDMAMFVMPQLRLEMLQALQNDEESGVESVIEQLDRFGLDKEEFDLLMEWGEKFIRNESMHFQSLVPTGTKMKLTRTYGDQTCAPKCDTHVKGDAIGLDDQGTHLRKVSRGAKKDGGDVSKGRGAAFKDVLDDDGESEEENEDDEEEDDDPTKAAAADVKGVKGVAAKKGAAAAKKPAAPKKPRAPAKPKAAKPAASKKRAAPSSDEDDF